MIGLPSKLAAYAIVAAALAAVGSLAWWRVASWRDDSQRLRVVEREYLAYRSTIEGYAKGEAKARKEYQDDRATTADVRAGVPVQSVRLRIDGAGVCQPAAAAGTAAVGTPAAAAGELQEADGLRGVQGQGPDIGADLYGIANDADDLRDDFASCQRDLALLRDSWPQCAPTLPAKRRWWQRR